MEEVWQQQDRELIDAQDYYTSRCQKCGSYAEEAHGWTACGVETYYMVCEFCGHQWGHE